MPSESSTKPAPFMFSVDVDMFPSSSAQMNKIPTLALARQDGIQPSLEAENLDQEDFQTTPAYTLYISPFDRYPLLRSQSSTFNLASSSFMHTSSATSDLHPSPTLAASLSSASSSAVPDLKPLRLAVLGKQLDPSKQLCRYECGDGKCRDDKCEDLHLSRLEGMIASGLLELTDEETADFLFSALPPSWLSAFQVHSPDRIREALQEVQHQASNDLTDKVARALSLIGSFPPSAYS